jgi:hypothetical protein
MIELLLPGGALLLELSTPVSDLQPCGLGRCREALPAQGALEQPDADECLALVALVNLRLVNRRGRRGNGGTGREELLPVHIEDRLERPDQLLGKVQLLLGGSLPSVRRGLALVRRR